MSDATTQDRTTAAPGPAPAASPADAGAVTLAALKGQLSPPFLVLGPTVKFPHPVVAHGEYGLVAVLTRDALLLKDEASGNWDAPAGRVDPDVLAMTQTMALSTAANAPADRLAVVLWFPNGFGASDDLVCASPDPKALAALVVKAMTEGLSRSDGPMAPWIGAYASAATLPAAEPSQEMLRVSQLIQSVLDATAGDAPIVCHGMNFMASDLADPRYFLPALLTAAHEDWSLVVCGGARRDGRRGAGGFDVSLEPDPAALVGYRVEEITPSTVYVMLGILVAAFKRCRTPRGEYHIEEVIEQFARFLEKKGLDATVVEDIDIRLLSGEDDAR